MEDADRLTLAQLTDVHLGPLPPYWPIHWNVKRTLGYINFYRKRRAYNSRLVTDAVLADLGRQPHDHIAVTGDLANIGMPSEFAAAREWLAALGRPEDVTVIPGNHDFYTRLLFDQGVERWRPYMRVRNAGDLPAGVPGPLTTGFPFVRILGRYALIALNSGAYFLPGDPAGRLGQAQIDRFCEISRALADLDFTRIVLIHHPPLPEHGWSRGLRDARAFEEALIETGSELLIHGHNHRDMISWRDTRTGPLAMVGAGAAAEGCYNLYRLSRRAGETCRIEMASRLVTAAEGTDDVPAWQFLDPAPDRRCHVI